MRRVLLTIAGAVVAMGLLLDSPSANVRVTPTPFTLGAGISSLTDGGILLGNGTGPIVSLGVASNGQIPIGDGTTDPVLATLTGSNNLSVTNGAGSITLSVPVSVITAGSGVGVTVSNVGAVRRVVYRIDVTEAHWDAAAVTQDLTVATLPAKTRIYDVIADVTEAFACTATCTSTTLSMVVGKGSGGAEYLDSFDVDAAIATFGDVDAERGAALDGVVNGEIPAWGSTQAIVARLTSGTGNLGDGAGTTNLSAGDVSLYLITETYP